MTYPLADKRTQWYGGVVASARVGAPLRVVWHSTETTTWPGYRDGSVAPHYTVAANPTLRQMVWRAHFPDDHYSRALRNEPGGVETNRSRVLQVEIVGTCDETRDWPASTLRTWDLPGWAVDGLAEFAAWCHTEHGIPLRGAGLWLGYGKDGRAPGRVPASYGASPARFTPQTWQAWRGHCGHQHVPEQSHGDPGRLPMDRILARAQQLLTPAPTEDDMPKLTDTIALGPGQSAVLGETGDNAITVAQAFAIQTAALVQIQRDQARTASAIEALAAELRAARGA